MRGRQWQVLDLAFVGVIAASLAGCGSSAANARGGGTGGNVGGVTGSGGGPGTMAGGGTSGAGAAGGAAMGGSTGAGGTTTSIGGTMSSGALTVPEIALIGGSSTSPAGIGQGGGNLHIVSSGGISFDPMAPAAAMPSIPDPPATAVELAGADLSADASPSGPVVLKGAVQSGGSDPVRRIVASGDVFISGTLRGADLGAARQGFDIEAPGFMVYIAGSVDASGSGGQAGGAVTVTADRVVITGSVLTAGNGSAGGGALTIKAASTVWMNGTADASGSDGTSAGGAGGPITVTAGSDVVTAGTIRSRGGAATNAADGTKGGDAGSIAIDCGGALTWSATVDGRGGTATAVNAAGATTGGAAANLTIGGVTPPKSVVIRVPAVITGGAGPAGGGNGGTAELDAHGGDLVLAGKLDVSGGDSAGKPGSGGTVLGYPGPESSTANLDISGQVLANGGSALASASAGASVNGGTGGLIKLVQHSLNGINTVEPTGQVIADGGKSAGAGTAGAGGMIYLFSKDGDGTVHGKLEARGGDAPDAGGTGGGGGFVYVFTGDGHDFTSGTLIIAPDGFIDVSGGNGTIGGSARNNGAGGVNLFPSSQTDEFDVEEIAVLINSDGVHGSDRGWIDNQGKIIARGGKSNGSGGDVVFHGKQQDGNETPLPGDVENTADGTGLNGDFAGL